jgi:drug/metabolite transporter superfamily protein YnfA
MSDERERARLRDDAAYGGIYIAASLVWLWLAEGQRPSASDLLGAVIAVAGALVIISMTPKHRRVLASSAAG